MSKKHSTSGLDLTDNLGMLVALAYAVCSACSSLLWWLGLGHWHGMGITALFGLLCLVVGLVAIICGFALHGQWRPVVLAGTGLVLVVASSFGLPQPCCDWAATIYNGDIPTEVQPVPVDGRGVATTPASSPGLLDKLALATVGPAGGLLLAAGLQSNRQCQRRAQASAPERGRCSRVVANARASSRSRTTARRSTTKNRPEPGVGQAP